MSSLKKYAAAGAALSICCLLVVNNEARAVGVTVQAISIETLSETANEQTVLGPLPITATATHASSNGQAEATATLDGMTSSLGVGVQAELAEPGLIIQAAAAALTESFTFSESGLVDFTFDVDGTVTATEGNTLELTLGAAVGVSVEDDVLEAGDLLLSLDSSEAVTGGDYQLTVGSFFFDANVAQEVTFVLLASGGLFGSGSYDADFLSTATLTAVSNDSLVETGSGNTYGAASNAAVPEPSAFLLALVSCFVLAIRRRCNRLAFACG